MILGTTRAIRVFAYPEPVDLRKGYEGLPWLADARGSSTQTVAIRRDSEWMHRRIFLTASASPVSPSSLKESERIRLAASLRSDSFGYLR